MRLGAVILTMGTRPAQLRELLWSVADQKGDPIDVVVVGNGVAVSRLPGLEQVRTLDLPENLGIPGGRNRGFDLLRALPPHERPEAVLVLDDDGRLAGPDAAELIREAFETDPRLGIVSFRICDPISGEVQRRHVPRVRVGDPNRSSEVTTFLGGACAIRTVVIDQVGGLPDDWFYCHEESDQAWRALDAGWSIEYRADLTLLHPKALPSRHAAYAYNVARNRVWLARRNLPWLLIPPYLVVWAALTVVRTRNRGALGAWLRGFAAGWRTPCGPRHPMSWSTAWRMTRLGRPPVI